MVRTLLAHGAVATGEMLLSAVLANSGGIVSLLLKAGADPDSPRLNSSPLIHIATDDRFVTCLDALLAAGVDTGARDEPGLTALHVSLQGNIVTPRKLILSGADVNARDNRGRTPLFDAAAWKIPENVQFLLDAGSDPLARDNDGWTALAEAISEGGIAAICDESGAVIREFDYRQSRLDTMRLLVDRIGRGNLTIFEACALGDLVRAKDILDGNPGALHRKDQYDHRAIHYAVSDGHTEIVRFLLSKYRFGDERDDPELIFTAADRGHLDIVRALVEHGADPCARDEFSSTPLHDAAGSGNADLVRFLLEQGANPVAFDDDYDTPLHYANTPGCARLLIEAGADINASNSYGTTPLHNASAEVARLLLSFEADIHVRDKDGETPLYSAIETGDEESQKTIFEYRGMGAASIFDLAAMGDLGRLEERLDRNPDYVHALDSGHHHRCLLHYAAETSRAEVTRYLLAQGADPSSRDDLGVTPLHIAAETDKSDVAELLLSSGADVNAVDEDWGFTPLHEAAYHRNLAVAKLLIDHGADVNAGIERGDRPLDQAESIAMRTLLWRNGGLYGLRRLVYEAPQWNDED